MAGSGSGSGSGAATGAGGGTTGSGPGSLGWSGSFGVSIIVASRSPSKGSSRGAGGGDAGGGTATLMVDDPSRFLPGLLGRPGSLGDEIRSLEDSLSTGGLATGAEGSLASDAVLSSP